MPDLDDEIHARHGRGRRTRPRPSERKARDAGIGNKDASRWHLPMRCSS